MDVSSVALSSVVVSFPQKVLLVDATSNLHLFLTHRLDAGPIGLTTIAHAFNYRVDVLRDAVKSATRVCRSRRAEGRILEDTDVPWGSSSCCHVLVSALCLRWRWRCLRFSRTLRNYGACHLIYNYHANHGDMRTMVVGLLMSFLRSYGCLQYKSRLSS